jgi:phage baseplate assembly protein W
MMNIAFPLRFDNRGRTAAQDTPQHVRDMLELLLFTAAGERVNRPDFGSGVLQLVFGPNSEEVAGALQFSVQAALQRWLGDIIRVDDLSVTSEDSTLTVAITYTLLSTGEQRTETLQQAQT